MSTQSRRWFSLLAVFLVAEACEKPDANPTSQPPASAASQDGDDAPSSPAVAEAEPARVEAEPTALAVRVPGCCEQCAPGGDCVDCKAFPEADCSGVRASCLQKEQSLLCVDPSREDVFAELSESETMDAFARGGLGLTGTGRGGGGTGEGTIGLGNTGLIGKGKSKGREPVYRVRQGEAEMGDSMDKDIIRRVVRAHINEVRSCYKSGVAKDPELAGTVRVKFEISASGTVSKAEVVLDELKDGKVGPCIADAVSGWAFPKGGGAGVVTYPFSLSSG